MTATHHIDDDTLLAYAAGSLPEAFSLMVASHVSLCDACRATVESFDALGGSIVENAAGVPVAEDSLARTLARIDAMPSDSAKPPQPRGTLPAPLQAYVGGDLDAVRWRPVGMGVKQAILPTSDDTATARLLFIPAGTAIPDHTHRGRELTLVLQGAFMDGTTRFGRGDVECADDDVTHTPVADISGDCICLAVTDAPLRFTALLPRIVQRFVGI